VIAAESATVAMCRGRSEIGPRALGNRSLLALPSTTRMRNHINLNIKRRESFRPLAPVVPLEHVRTYFDGIQESPFMLFVARVKEEFQEPLAAVTHIDGTARVQAVRREDNAFLHELLILVGESTGIPVLLNTSLNFPVRGSFETMFHTCGPVASMAVRSEPLTGTVGHIRDRFASPYRGTSRLVRVYPRSYWFRARGNGAADLSARLS
jgi:hypothetical protein